MTRGNACFGLSKTRNDINMRLFFHESWSDHIIRLYFNFKILIANKQTFNFRNHYKNNVFPHFHFHQISGCKKRTQVVPKYQNIKKPNNLKVEAINQSGFNGIAKIG